MNGPIISFSQGHLPPYVANYHVASMQAYYKIPYFPFLDQLLCPIEAPQSAYGLWHKQHEVDSFHSTERKKHILIHKVSYQAVNSERTVVTVSSQDRCAYICASDVHVCG